MADESLVPDDEPKSTIPDAVVTLEEPAPKEGDVVVTPAAKKEPLDAAAKGAADIAKSLEEEKKKRIAAEAKARNEALARQQAEGRAVKAEGRISAEVQQNINANRTAANNAIEAAKAKREQAKKDFIALQAEGKFDEAFEATQIAAQASAEIANAENYLTRLEAQVKDLETQPPVETQKPQNDDKGRVDPVTGIKFTHTTADWVDKHRENWKDQDFRMECDAASRKAKREGLEVDTPEYFEFIEKRLQREGYLSASSEDETGSDEPPPAEKPKPQIARKPAGASAGAAPSRAVPGTPGAGKKGVKLSGMEREIARSLVESLPEIYGKDANPDQIYARQKMAIEQED